MSGFIEVIYDRLVADEKLSSGTKYERLTAIAFRQITDRATVHDLRLRGESGVAHQIDAVVGDERKRVLIEAKDYDKPVSLPIVRNFWAATEDIGPDEAFIVTTEGFSRNAIKYAAAKGISLAVLRPPRDEDWGNLCRRIVLSLTATGQTGPPRVTWQLHPDDHDKIDDDGTQGLLETRELQLSDESGALGDFYPLLVSQLNEDYGLVPLGGEGQIGRTNEFVQPTWLHAPGLPSLRVEAWKWEVGIASSTTEVVMGDGIGDLAAELVLKTVDGSIHAMVTNRQMQAWTFDGKNVVPRP